MFSQLAEHREEPEVKSLIQAIQDEKKRRKEAEADQASPPSSDVRPGVPPSTPKLVLTPETSSVLGTKIQSAPPLIPPTLSAKATAQPRKLRAWMGVAAGVLLVLAAGVVALLFHQKLTAPTRCVAARRDWHLAGRRCHPGERQGFRNFQPAVEAGSRSLPNPCREGSYQPSQTTVTVKAGQGAAADIKLQPLASMLRLLTDFTPAPIALDGHPQSNLQSGTLILYNVAAGSHILAAGSKPTGAAILFEARDGAPPLVDSIDAKRFQRDCDH